MTRLQIREFPNGIIDWTASQAVQGNSFCPHYRVVFIRYSLQQRKQLNFNMLSMPKREHKTNYSVDAYYKDAMRIGPSKTEKAPKLPHSTLLNVN